MKQSTVALIVAFLFLNAYQLNAQNKNEKKCKSEVTGGKYKWVGIAPLLQEPGNLYGYVLVKPKYIRRDFMIQLAKRLKSEYCNAENFQVIIFDDGKYANSYSMQDYVSSKGKIILMRGFYSFNRSTGVDGLEFSTKFGNPTTEIQIDMSKIK